MLATKEEREELNAIVTLRWTLRIVDVRNYPQ
jgi:hypothetical protein